MAGVVMQFGLAARATCALLFLLAAAGLVLFAMRSRATEGGVAKAFLAIAVLMCGAATVEVFGVAHRLVPGGIERVAPGRSRAVLRWADVVDVQWAPAVRWYEVRTRAGELVRVYAQLSGIRSFARAVLDGVPPPVIDGRSGLRQRLEAEVHGVSPDGEADREEWRRP